QINAGTDPLKVRGAVADGWRVTEAQATTYILEVCRESGMAAETQAEIARKLGVDSSKTSETVKVQAKTLQDARHELQKKLAAGIVVIQETVLNDGSSKKVEAEGTTVEEGSKKAKAKLPANATVEKEDVLQQATRETVHVPGFEESEARQQVAVSRPKRIASVSMTKSGRK